MSQSHPYATKRTQSERWEEQFQRLIEFKRANGHCNVPFRYPPEPSLGRWVSLQRSIYRDCPCGTETVPPPNPTLADHIAQHRMKKLVAVGFDFNPIDPKQRPWEWRFSELLEFINEHGHALVPLRWKVNTQLANWVAAQRKEYSRLQNGQSTRITEEQIDLLNSVNFCWNVLKRKGRDEESCAPDDVSQRRPALEVGSTARSSRHRSTGIAEHSSGVVYQLDSPTSSNVGSYWRPPNSLQPCDDHGRLPVLLEATGTAQIIGPESGRNSSGASGFVESPLPSAQLFQGGFDGLVGPATRGVVHRVAPEWTPANHPAVPSPAFACQVPHANPSAGRSFSLDLRSGQSMGCPPPSYPGFLMSAGDFLGSNLQPDGAAAVPSFTIPFGGQALAPALQAKASDGAPETWSTLALQMPHNPTPQQDASLTRHESAAYWTSRSEMEGSLEPRSGDWGVDRL